MVIETEMEAAALREFADQFTSCWACGFEPGYPDGIDYWPRALVIHHICMPQRVHERYNFARLCGMCHNLSHYQQIRIADHVVPRLDPCHVLWLKRRHDRYGHDRKKLGHFWRGELPKAIRPPKWYEELYKKNRRRGYPGTWVQEAERRRMHRKAMGEGR